MTPPKAEGPEPGAGEWKWPPGKRHYDSPNKRVEPTFNEDYERCVQGTNGCPTDGREYYVERNGESVFFDAVRTEIRDGKTVEIYIDAKGKYDQFIDAKNPTEFQWWWGNSKTAGLPAMMETAKRQVTVAGDGEVEWWCAEPKSAQAFNREMRMDARLRGRVRAIYKPMPKSQ